ncbi:hypothetical protein D3C71_1746850 [compost metagenome]
MQSRLVFLLVVLHLLLSLRLEVLQFLLQRLICAQGGVARFLHGLGTALCKAVFEALALRFGITSRRRWSCD